MCRRISSSSPQSLHVPAGVLSWKLRKFGVQEERNTRAADPLTVTSELITLGVHSIQSRLGGQEHKRSVVGPVKLAVAVPFVGPEYLIIKENQG